MRKFLAATVAVGAIGVSGPALALAANPHSPPQPTGPATGQPSQSCQVTPSYPGNTFNSPGSAFNGSAGNVYANPDAQGGVSSGGNPKVVAQYDVACFQASQH